MALRAYFPVRHSLLLVLGLVACSSRLDLGHNKSVTTAPSAPTPAICEGVRCFAGPLIELGASSGNAKGLVLDHSNAYWAATAAHSLMITPKLGGTTVAIPTPEGGPYRVAGNDANLYFTSNTGGYVAALSKATRSVDLLVIGEDYPESIAVANDGVYFSDQKLGTLKRLPLDGSKVETLVQGIHSGGELALDADFLYYADSGVGEIHAIDRVTGENAELTAGRSHPGAPLPRGDSLYFLELGSETAGYGDGRLLRMPRDGGAVEVLIEGLDAPTGLAADSTALYLCTRGNEQNGYRGRIVRLGDDGRLDTLVTGQPEPFAIAVDERAVYFTSDAENRLRAIER